MSHGGQERVIFFANGVKADLGNFFSILGFRYARES